MFYRSVGRTCSHWANKLAPLSRANTFKLNGPSLSAAMFCTNTGGNGSRRAGRSVARAAPRQNAVSTKVYQVAKTGFDFSIVAGATVMAGAMFYFLFSTLFSSSSPVRAYNESLDLVRQHPGIAMLLGDPIKGFNEKTRTRGRIPSEEGTDRMGKYVRTSYEISGPRGTATVITELREHSGVMDMEYVAVVLPGRNPIFVLDNRIHPEDDLGY